MLYIHPWGDEQKNNYFCYFRPFKKKLFHVLKKYKPNKKVTELGEGSKNLKAPKYGPSMGWGHPKPNPYSDQFLWC